MTRICLFSGPNGCNCIDIEVYTVRPGEPISIRGSSKFKVPTEELFPIVEGMFGPLRVPLPRSPAVLTHEYGSLWRSAYRAKVINASGNAKHVDVDPTVTRRAVWPRVDFNSSSCKSLLGGFVGAGTVKKPTDVPWRFF